MTSDQVLAILALAVLGTPAAECDHTDAPEQDVAKHRRVVKVSQFLHSTRA